MNNLSEEEVKALEKAQKASQELYDNDETFREIVELGSVLNDVNGRILTMIFSLKKEVDELKGKVNKE